MLYKAIVRRVMGAVSGGPARNRGMRYFGGRCPATVESRPQPVDSRPDLGENIRRETDAPSIHSFQHG